MTQLTNIMTNDKRTPIENLEMTCPLYVNMGCGSFQLWDPALFRDKIFEYCANPNKNYENCPHFYITKKSKNQK